MEKMENGASRTDGKNNNAIIQINRPVFDQASFDKQYGSQYVDLSVAGRLKKFYREFKHEPSKHFKQWALTCAPPAQWLMEYEWKRGLLADFLSGCTVGIMNIPQGMAYGLLAGLPPQYGLYTSFFPPLFYAFFGTSRHISFGTFAVISLMVSAVIDKNVPINNVYNNSSNLSSTNDDHSFWFCGSEGGSTDRDFDQVLNVAFALTFLVGFCQIIFGILHVGFIAVYLSDQLVEGLTTGAAIQVFTSQVSKLFGISGLPSASGIFGIIQFYFCFFANITGLNWASIVVSIISIIILIVVKQFIEPPIKKRFKLPVPVELLVVILATVTSYFADLNQNYNLPIVGIIPTGIPPPRSPDYSIMIDILPDAITIAIVIYSISVSMSKLFAKKHDYKINANQEWFAYGFVELLSSFFSCHCSSASLSRSAVQEGQGGRSQIASLFAALIILIVLVALAPLFEVLPQCALAAIIVVNLKNMFLQFSSLPILWKRSKIDFLIWVVTFVAVVVLDISLGLVIGLIFAILTVLFRAQWPDSICLGRISGTELYKGSNAYSGTKEIPHMKIYRFESPLYFANASLFKEQLYICTNLDPLEKKKILSKKLKEKKLLSRTPSDIIVDQLNENSVINASAIDNGSSEEECRRMVIPIDDHCDPNELRAIVVDCSSFPYMDLMGVDALKQIYEEYKEIGVLVMFASVKVSVRQMFEECEFFKSVPKSSLFLSVHDAVISFLTTKSIVNALEQ